MGIYLGQMPPAEMARLKAEIAETLIANFSYPRFYDYRTNALRMRPVDRAKRQEVWTFLSSFDFNTFSRIDVASPDFQRQVERLLIQFVQRNRAFFGQQGRKRMSDVRSLITNSSTSITEGLRGHLSGRATTQPPFGSARPVTSWSKSNGAGRLEAGWEQVANATMLLQQQYQEVRGETRPGVNGDARIAAPPPTANGAMTNGATVAPTPPRRSQRLRTTTQNGSSNDTVAPPARPTGAVPPARPIPQDELHPVNPPSGPLAPQASAAPAPEAAKLPLPADQRALRATTAGDTPASPAKPDEKASTIRQNGFSTQAPQATDSLLPPAPVESPVAAQSQASTASPATSPQRELTRTEPLAPSLKNQQDSATVMLSDEDVVIFEEMRHQLIVWLRIEVVRAGVDLTGQSPAQLLEVLGQQDGVDETRLQIVSTLLGLANQVIANGYATLVEYKQGMMFYLIHTRRAR
ncbi:MAG TPA: hypothetical protein VJO32_07560 [Ktedonobacteraceae bacterium]|nr:hypothetical protein [Ktedonobacteraceae bacterium]